MKIKVTQQHIDAGIKKKCLYCPVALAIKDVFPTEYVNVSDLYVRIGDNVYDLFPIVTRFILDFDYGYPVSPFEFELGAPRI